jgi:hypothetical protein
MKKLLFIVLILISCYSCKKDKTEYILHDSEIFFNDDTLFMGKWEYLYTWSGDMPVKTIENLPSIHIKHKGDYEKFKDGIVLQSGKIDTVGYKYGKLLIKFYPNGIKSQTILSQTIYTSSKDTLILGFRAYLDMYIDEYYKRMK